MSSKTNEKLILIGVGVAVIIIATVCYYLYNRGKVEGYGGPVKTSVVRRIPITDCFSMCDRWENHCLITNPYSYSDNKCQRSSLACKYSCYYSNVQRF